MKPSLNLVPKHVGIILDGNRRFAKQLMIKPWKGHEWGAKKVEKIIDWCKEFKIKELTLYTFSIENFDRPKREFNYLMKLFEKEFENFKNNQKVNEVKVNFIGRISMFPKNIQILMNKIMNKTKHNIGTIINFAMAYGGRAEIIDAVRKLSKDLKSKKVNISKINEEFFKNYLYTKSEPDLIIRTSESRLSGFLLYQSAYSEIIFLPKKLWPEFSKKDFVKCLENYSNRERRFGR